MSSFLMETPGHVIEMRINQLEDERAVLNFLKPRACSGVSVRQGAGLGDNIQYCNFFTPGGDRSRCWCYDMFLV